MKRSPGTTDRRRVLAIAGAVAAGFVITSLIGLANPNDAIREERPDRDEVYRRVYNGWKWWHVYCYRCHGLDAYGSSIANNLRESVNLLTYDDFLTIVREGRPKKGMQSWKQLLDDKQITDVYIYLTARSQNVLPPGRPDEVGENESPWIPPQGWPADGFPTPPADSGADESAKPE